jgi:hypothetical protein
MTSDGEMCYCCCLGGGWPVATSAAESRPVSELREGDEIRVADVSGGGLSWRTAPVAITLGTAAGPAQPVMKLAYGEGGRLVVTPDHLFLTRGGALVRADRLVPGEHELVGSAGEPVSLTSATAGFTTGAIHHVALTAGPTTEVDGHLLDSNGVISSDYALQIGYAGAGVD